MPEETLERTALARDAELPSLATDALTERGVRDSLRRQIGLLEHRLGAVFATSFPRQGIEFGVAAAGGPRVLDVAELERVRDGLVIRLREAETELARRGRIEERHRAVLEEMLVAPERYRGLRITARDIGEPSCRSWTSEPRLGVLGMLMGWWRVKVSSGCPLASGRGRGGRPRTKHPQLSQLGSKIAKASPSATGSQRARRDRGRARVPR